jgi:hypothetical protein
MVGKGVCSIKAEKPEEGDSALYILEVEDRGCSQRVTRMVANLEKAIVMGLETVREMVREMDQETYQRLSAVGMMTAEHVLLYQTQSD